ncbi:helix-turn-helix domain-containing protein [Enterobacter kobei]|uniref:helix-turn-helix domain-containing protein n=1 Tax=Enterobacter kobei TaxID=208224 RepID=UPI003CEE4AA7
MPGKETKVVIPEDGKETLSERLRSLIGKRSARTAAKDWGLSFSTLNNYLNRGTEPSFSVAVRIAEIEGVSIEWLAFGGEVSSLKNEGSHNRLQVDSNEFISESSDGAKVAWMMVYDSLEKEDTEALLRLIHREGVKGILNAAQTGTLDAQDFMSLSESDRQRVLRLAQQLREGASEENLEIDPAHPTHKQAS